MQAFGKARAGVLSVALAAAFTATAFAQQPSAEHLQAARAAIDAIGATDQFDSILIGAALNLKTRLIQDNPNFETVIGATVDETALSLAGRRTDLENEAARIYAGLFTQDELQAIADFYSTEAGQKLIQAGPRATREVLRAADIWSRGVGRDLAEEVGTKLQDRIANNAAVNAPDGTPQAPQVE